MGHSEGQPGLVSKGKITSGPTQPYEVVVVVVVVYLSKYS